MLRLPQLMADFCATQNFRFEATKTALRKERLTSRILAFCFRKWQLLVVLCEGTLQWSLFFFVAIFCGVFFVFHNLQLNLIVLKKDQELMAGILICAG